MGRFIGSPRRISNSFGQSDCRLIACLPKPRMSPVREDIWIHSQTFLCGSWICHRTGSPSWAIHNPRKNAYTLRLLPIQLHVRGLCVVFIRHMTKQLSDWPELFGMVRTKKWAQRYQTTFLRGHFVSELVGWERDYHLL